MKSITYFLILLALVGGRLNADDYCSTDIRVLSIIFRHGAKAANRYLPNDENNSKWTVGIGQLTQQGMKQMYKSGQLVRDKYAPLFDHYDSDKLLARSSAVDRTLTSAVTFLAALVQPKGDQIFLQGLNWQPAAIYTDPIVEQILEPEVESGGVHRQVSGITASDPATMEIMRKISSIEAKAISSNYSDLFTLKDVFDNIVSELHAGFDLPYGLDKSLIPKIRLLKEISVMAFSSDPVIRCTLSSRMLTDFIEKTEKVLRNESHQSIFVSSTHDNNLIGILSFLTDYRSEGTPFAATLIFEVRALNSDCQNFEVKLIYRKDVESDEAQLPIKGCDSPCTFVQLKKIVQDIENECRSILASPSAN